MRLGRSLTLLVLAALPSAALALVGCGGGSRAPSTGATQAGTSAVTISVSSTDVGDVLADSQYRALYLFKKDTGGRSTCFGACAKNWPPVRTTGAPTAGAGAKASLIGTTKRSDGQPQVTYNGHPLYLYAGDNAPLAMKGQGLNAFGGTWYVVSPSGNQVTARPTAGPRYGY